MRLAAKDSCFKGLLIRLAMAAEPSSVASSAMPIQLTSVSVDSVAVCAGSV